MKCPVDGATLQMTERSGVEIDYCPQCRGVWLDRGELDKIIERMAPAMELPEPPRPVAPPPPPRGLPDDGRRPYGERRDRDERYSDDDDDGYRKRKGLLGDLFDF